MKKFLSIAMIALAAVFASSCNKDNSSEESTKFINTWVTDEIKATDYFGDEFTDLLKNLPESAQTAIKAQLDKTKFKGVVSVKNDGNGFYGVLVDKANLNLLVTAVTTWVENHGSELTDEQKTALNKIIYELKPTINSLKDNDVIGTSFTWTVKENHGATGILNVTTKTVKTDDDGDEITGEDEKPVFENTTLEIAWKDLSDDAVTLTYGDQKPISCKSASAAKVTVGTFYDEEELFPADNE